METAELLQRCRSGDSLAWEALVRRYQARVYGLALSYVRNPEEARDVAQEIFVRIYRKLSSFNDQETFLPWLLRVGRNVCIDHLRRAKARGSDVNSPIEEEQEWAAPGPTPESEAASGESKRLIHAALGRLSETNREMIILKEIQGLKLEEIASLLALPLGTVKSRSNRARLELARAVLALDPTAGTTYGA
jgi:RNA polymerase sigma-70 factor (ECF subfamily)